MPGIRITCAPGPLLGRGSPRTYPPSLKLWRAGHTSRRPCVALAKTGFRPRLTLACRSPSAHARRRLLESPWPHGKALALCAPLWRAPSLGPSQRLRPHKSARSIDIAQDKLTWRGDLLDLSDVEGHPTSPVPCPAHTTKLTCRGGGETFNPISCNASAVRCSVWFGMGLFAIT
jgi:hypothetical protein